MASFLVLRLDGPMQAWGTHTFEDFRPSNLYPTRSGLLGLLGACLGLERNDLAGHSNLSDSVEFTVRVDTHVVRPGKEDTLVKKRSIKLPDFHTVMDARKVDGSANKFPVVSRREYLFDAAFTVVVGSRPESSFSLVQIADALRRPCFTPALGRRSCPLTRPLLEGRVEADSPRDALGEIEPKGDLIYSESEPSDQPVRVRDVPMHGKTRQFGTRLVYVHKEPKCS